MSDGNEKKNPDARRDSRDVKPRRRPEPGRLPAPPQEEPDEATIEAWVRLRKIRESYGR